MRFGLVFYTLGKFCKQELICINILGILRVISRKFYEKVCMCLPCEFSFINILWL